MLLLEVLGLGGVLLLQVLGLLVSFLLGLLGVYAIPRIRTVVVLLLA